MTLGLQSRAAVEEVVVLADTFADRVIADLANVSTTQELHDGLSGAFLVFLRESLLLANSVHD